MIVRYEEDGYGWAKEQAALLRAGRFSEADVENLLEEIEDMGQGKQRELENRLKVLLHHLLKWQYQPERQGKSWRSTIKVQRMEILSHLAKNPSLKSHIPSAIAEAYQVSRTRAAGETDIEEDGFPELCPWTWEQIMDHDFWPESN